MYLLIWKWFFAKYLIFFLYWIGNLIAAKVFYFPNQKLNLAYFFPTTQLHIFFKFVYRVTRKLSIHTFLVSPFRKNPELILMEQKINNDTAPLAHPVRNWLAVRCKETTLERADFTPQLLKLVTAGKERGMFIFFFLSSFCQLLSPRFFLLGQAERVQSMKALTKPAYKAALSNLVSFVRLVVREAT